MTMTKRTYLLAGTAVLALTLAACGGGDAPDEETDTAGGETSEAAEEETTDTEDVAVDGAECLVGTWEMTAEDMEEQVGGILGEDAEVTADGSSSMTFDGTNATSEVDVTSTFSMDLGEEAGGVVEGSSETVGTIVFAYSVDGDSVTFDELVSADGTATTTVEVDGTPQTQEVPFSETAELTVGTSQTFTCDASSLTLSASAGDTEIQQTFTRR